MSTRPLERLTAALADRYRIERRLGAPRGIFRLSLQRIPE
jgi:hypothetical protein